MHSLLSNEVGTYLKTKDSMILGQEVLGQDLDIGVQVHTSGICTVILHKTNERQENMENRPKT